MAFSTARGRPKTTPRPSVDIGTPELRMKHALGVTAEPVDLCLDKGLITPKQHRSALHLRWLYTLRYGAPSLSTYYGDRIEGGVRVNDDPEWRSLREREYHEAVALLQAQRRYEAVMRVVVYNETPAFLSQKLQRKAFENHALADELLRGHLRLCEGLELLVQHWRRRDTPPKTC